MQAGQLRTFDAPGAARPQITVCREWLSRRREALAVAGLFGIGMALRLWAFGWFPLREDEALYGYWARLIASGRDPMLERVAVDKPPFFIYTLANVFTVFGPSETAGRLLNEFCSLAALILLWVLARRLYGGRTALIALAVFALSPFAIGFAPTLFVDPMLAAWLLLALVCASYGFGLGAGLAFGMAFATKQNALLFAPLIVGALVVARMNGGHRSEVGGQSSEPGTLNPEPASRLPLLRLLISLIAAAAAFYFVWFKVWQWDGWRILPAEIPSFWQQAWHSYGGMALLPPQLWGQRIAAWAEVWRWLGGSLAGTALLAALVALVGWSALRRRADAGRRWDILLLLFVLAFVGGHVALRFQPWDRYLLGIAPLLALLAARGILIAWGALAGRRAVRGALIALTTVVFVWGGGLAATARLPVGGDHGAYAGIEQVARYLQNNMPPYRGVLYQRWLGWHWDWYLWNGPSGRVYWANPGMLAADVSKAPEGYTRFVVFPGWELDEQPALAQALAGIGMQLTERFVVRANTGSVQFIVYQITPERTP